MTKNHDIAQRMMEHLKTQPGRPLQSEEFQTTIKLIEDQPQAEGLQILELALVSPSTCLSPQRFGKSPRGKFRLTSKRGVRFSLETTLKTLFVWTRGKGTSLESIQAKGSPVREAEPITDSNQEDPVIPFPVGAKTRPMTRSANKQGPSIQIPASTKRPMKTLGKGSSSNRSEK